MPLSQEEGRVIGSLVEKQLTTPQQYPLTSNALLLACNQSSNRDPVVEFDEQVHAGELHAVALDKIDSDIFASATGWNSVSGRFPGIPYFVHDAYMCSQ